MPCTHQPVILEIRKFDDGLVEVRKWRAIGVLGWAAARGPTVNIYLRLLAGWRPI